MAGQEEQYRPSRVGEIFNEYVNNSQDAFAQAFRQHLAEAARQKTPVSWIDFAADSLDDDGFIKLFSNTEPCITLKFVTLTPGSLHVGDYLCGTILRDDEEHYTFIQDIDGQPATASACAYSPRSSATAYAPAASAATPLRVMPIRPLRNPIIYRGKYINIHRAKDGSLYPIFCRPVLSDRFTFADFCREAASELLAVVSLLEKMTPGMSA